MYNVDYMNTCNNEIQKKGIINVCMRVCVSLESHDSLDLTNLLDY